MTIKFLSLGLFFIAQLAWAATPAPSSTPSDNLDSAGCGDGTKSAPNAWLISIKKQDPNIFQETALLSVNSFRITNVSGDTSAEPAKMGLSDASKVAALIYQVTFYPGVDSAAWPKAHSETIINRDAVLSKLKSLGATITCNNFVTRRNHPIRKLDH